MTDYKKTEYVVSILFTVIYNSIDIKLQLFIKSNYHEIFFQKIPSITHGSVRRCGYRKGY